jgi:hypothetical protein
MDVVITVQKRLDSATYVLAAQDALIVPIRCVDVLLGWLYCSRFLSTRPAFPDYQPSASMNFNSCYEKNNL